MSIQDMTQAGSDINDGLEWARQSKIAALGLSPEVLSMELKLTAEDIAELNSIGLLPAEAKRASQSDPWDWIAKQMAATMDISPEWLGMKCVSLAASLGVVAQSQRDVTGSRLRSYQSMCFKHLEERIRLPRMSGPRPRSASARKRKAYSNVASQSKPHWPRWTGTYTGRLNASEPAPWLSIPKPRRPAEALHLGKWGTYV